MNHNTSPVYETDDIDSKSIHGAAINSVNKENNSSCPSSVVVVVENESIDMSSGPAQKTNTDENKTKTSILGNSINNNMNQNASTKSKECQTCIQLLQHVLFNNTTTNSSKLLQSMMIQQQHHHGQLEQEQEQQQEHKQQLTDTSLPASTVRLIQNGVQVNIPTTTVSDTNKILLPVVPEQQPNSSTDGSVLLPSQHELKSPQSPPATSLVRRLTSSLQQTQHHQQQRSENSTILATTSTTDDTRFRTNRFDNGTTNNVDDWIDITCRTCSDFGPEANARAFVMGPNPLSIVICHNRLVSSIKQQLQGQKQLNTINNIHDNVTTTPIRSEANNNLHGAAPVWRDLQSRLSNNRSDTPSTVVENQMVREMDEIVTHELIHIYDVRQLRMNLIHCNDLAYSEIRAAREAECSSFKKTHQLNNALVDHNPTSQVQPQQQPADILLQQHQKQFEECVRTRATTATRNLFPFRAKRCIQNVFHKAINDYRPQNSS